MISSLDNPVWEALSSKQSNFNIGNEVLKYFASDIAPFVGLKHWDANDLHELIDQLPAQRSFSVMKANKEELPASFEIVFSTPLYQMYCPVLKPVTNNTIIIRCLIKEDVPMMLELTAKTKPGPFYERTIEFGNYLGIFNNNKLVAMTGDRLSLNGYTEISAICTNPDHLGNGYASYLITKASERIIQEGNIPFLHVRTDNLRAIEVYKKMGFEIRADIYFAIFRKR